MMSLRCTAAFAAAVLALAACAMAASHGTGRKITWQQSRGQVNCAVDSKYLCGRVQSVHDGDTIRVRPDDSAAAASVRVRLVQLDAPELGQPYGLESRDALTRILPPGSRVCVVSPGRDHYRRVLGFVCLQEGAGMDVNAWLLAGGDAWCYLGRCCPAYAAAVEAAKAAGRGLWGASGGRQPTPPWLYRRRQRQQKLRRPHPLRYKGANDASPAHSSDADMSSALR